MSQRDEEVPEYVDIRTAAEEFMKDLNDALQFRIDGALSRLTRLLRNGRLMAEYILKKG